MRMIYGALDVTAYPYGIEFGMDTGAPQNVTEVLASLLQDGEIELSSRASNRTLQFNVLVEGADLAECATNEAALIAETEKLLNTLAIDPEDFGPVAVYETFRAQVTHARDDNGELARMRLYTVTVKALPFPRSEGETVTPALASSGTTTTSVDTGSATTGWTASGSPQAVGAVAVVSGAVKVSTAAFLGATTISMTRGGAITTSATPYLAIDWKPETPVGSTALRAYGDGVELTRVAQKALPSGFTRTWFLVAAASIAALRLDHLSYDTGNPLSVFTTDTVRSLAIDNIDRTDVKPAIGTGRQLQRTISVAGTARSNGSVTIEHPTDALGDVLAYFSPDEYSPPLRQYRVSGGTVTAVASLVSGAREPLIDATPTFDMPNPPPGTYLLVARYNLNWASGLTTGAALQWTVTGRLAGGGMSGTYSKTRQLTVDDNLNSWVIKTLDRITLPRNDVDAAAATALTRVALTATAIGGTITQFDLDEVWLFNVSTGQLVQASCGDGVAAPGGSAKRMFITAPTVSVPRPLLRVGDAVDGSDSFYPRDAFWQVPVMHPSGVNVLTVTTNALDAEVSLRAFSRWHTNPAS